ncbi:hypothetical protein [Nocardia lijiangensis]|uniref:hypothetical protein n=1 Tax=Nocardia lijiangensis TaxID=299618 RepID=UPI003D747112
MFASNTGPATDSDLELTALTLVSGCLEVLAMWLRGDLTIERTAFADFLVTMILTATHIEPTSKT